MATPLDIRPTRWRLLAEDLGVEEAALRAVAQVESGGSGFLLTTPPKPKILFEGHIFHLLTKGRFTPGHPAISYPHWTKRHYLGGAREYERLEAALRLDREAALKSCSWGAFQILGTNHRLCGHATVELFVEAQQTAEGQLTTFAQFIKQPRLLEPLRQKDWPTFAFRYNGPAFRKNRYDEKLQQAYARFAPIPRGPLTPHPHRV